MSVLTGNLNASNDIIIGGKISNSYEEVQGVVSSTQNVGGALSSFGIRGLSAYEVAVENGFEGTETEWLESLRNGLNPDESSLTLNAEEEIFSIYGFSSANSGDMAMKGENNKIEWGKPFIPITFEEIDEIFRDIDKGGGNK